MSKLLTTKVSTHQVKMSKLGPKCWFFFLSGHQHCPHPLGHECMYIYRHTYTLHTSIGGKLAHNFLLTHVKALATVPNRSLCLPCAWGEGIQIFQTCSHVWLRSKWLMNLFHFQSPGRALPPPQSPKVFEQWQVCPSPLMTAESLMAPLPPDTSFSSSFLTSEEWDGF